MATGAHQPSPATVLPDSQVPDPMQAPPLRWGILAPGGIARTFAAAAHRHTRQRVVAVGSRSAERAAAFSRDFDIPRAYPSYRELAEDPEVDVVYVASPHSEHLEHALLAIGAGKPVLVEKAFTRNAAQARQLVAAARERGVFAMEAMWTRCLPHIDVLRRVLAAGMLGEVTTVIADHGQPMTPDAASRLFAPELAGGALLDLGVYPVSFASLVLGHFATVTAVGTPAFTGVDGQVSAIVTNAAGAQAVLNATLFARTPTTATISGTQGRLELDGAFYSPTTMRLIGRDGTLLDTFTPAQREGGLRYEIAEVARCVDAGLRESEQLPLQETVQVMEAMDDIRRQIGVAYPGEGGAG